MKSGLAAGAQSTGLSSAEALQRRAAFGANTIAEEMPLPWRRFGLKFWGPIPWLLEAALLLELVLGQDVEAAVIGALLLFNAILGFIQEGKAGAALAALKTRLAPTALVLRDGSWIRLAAAELVPGDAIRLSLGVLVPADATIVSGSVLIDQSMLTGESVPVDTDAGGRVYAGSLVRRGEAIADVTAIGSKTYFGRTAELVRIARAASTEQAAIFATTRNLALVNGLVALLVIAYGYRLALPPADLIGLALTALLATIPVALPATFTLSAAFAAQTLARFGVLLTRLSATHEAAAMDILCTDKTGTLTQNTLGVADVRAMPGFDRDRVLGLAVLASSETDQDPIDNAIRTAASGASRMEERLERFVPFDPSTKMSEAFALASAGDELRIIKGAFEVISGIAEIPTGAQRIANELAAQGNRVIAVAAGPPHALHLAGVIALSDPPREDAGQLITALRDMRVRTIMVTGDSPMTAATIAREVGIAGEVCQGVSDELARDNGVFARILPEDKYRLVQALQKQGHVVGMCGDGVNDAPALRQAQIGIAVSSATDVAKAAAGMVLTQPGLAGVVHAVVEGRIAFQRLLTYTFNMLVKKFEIVLFLAIGLAMTGHAIMTPALMVVMFMTNDFLSMSLTTDRASPSPAPSVWRMRSVTGAAIVLGVCKLTFSTAILAIAKFKLGLGPGELQALALVTLVFGNQALLYVLREPHRLWHSRPSVWVVASSVAGIVIVVTFASLGFLTGTLPWPVIALVFAASIGFALVLDQIKLPVRAAFRID